MGGPRLELEQGVFVGDVDELFVALPSPVGDDRERGVPFLAVFAHDARIIVGVGGEKMLGVVVAVYDDFAQSVVDMHVLAAFAHQVLQELGEQSETIPGIHRIR